MSLQLSTAASAYASSSSLSSSTLFPSLGSENSLLSRTYLLVLALAPIGTSLGTQHVTLSVVPCEQKFTFLHYL
jgi:hypothetical protein